MNNNAERSILRTFLLTAWGMTTLVLLFAVIFLVFEMIRRGRAATDLNLSQSFSVRTESEPAPAPAPLSREIQLYFPVPDGSHLGAEPRRIEFSGSTVANCRRALEALIEGPRELLAPLMPPTTRIRGMFLVDDELIIDFSRDLEAGHLDSASAELFMVHGIVASLGQPALRGAGDRPVGKIRFLFEGSPPQETFPAHIDLSDPVYPEKSRAWLQTERSANG